MTAAADLAGIRLFSHPNAKLGRFTIDRLMMILGKLDQDIEVIVITVRMNAIICIRHRQAPGPADAVVDRVGSAWLTPGE